MRTMILLCLAVLLWSSSAEAQARRTKSTARKAARVPPAARAAKPAPAVIRLQSLDSNMARGQVISDPTIRAMNSRGNGRVDVLGPVGIPGVPRGANGFANGRLLLRPTVTTTFGATQGSGTVGTGSSLGSPGSTGPFMGVNGKSPYAGSSMWGNARNLPVIRGDSAVRTPRVRD